MGAGHRGALGAPGELPGLSRPGDGGAPGSSQACSNLWVPSTSWASLAHPEPGHRGHGERRREVSGAYLIWGSSHSPSSTAGLGWGQVRGRPGEAAASQANTSPPAGVLPPAPQGPGVLEEGSPPRGPKTCRRGCIQPQPDPSLSCFTDEDLRPPAEPLAQCTLTPQLLGVPPLGPHKVGLGPGAHGPFPLTQAR